jgi:ParB/RepB/Spo0J family partition protein
MIFEEAVLVKYIKPVVAPTSKSQQKSLLQQGQKQPIRLRLTEDPDYIYEVTDGRRRVSDLIASGATTVMALIENNISDAQAHLDALILNAGKPNFMDEARHLKALQSKYNYSEAQLAEMTNYSASKINNLLQLCLLIPEFQHSMLKGDLKQGAGRALAKLPREVQEDVLLRLGNKISIGFQ